MEEHRMRAILLSAAAAIAIGGVAVAQGQSGGAGGAQPPPMVTNPGGGAGTGAQRPQGGADAQSGTVAQPRRQDARQPDQPGEGRPGVTERRPEQTDQRRHDANQLQRNQQPDRDTAQGQRDGKRQQEQAGDQNRQNRPTASGNVSGRTRINISSPQQKTVIKNNIVRTSVQVPAGVRIAVGSVLPATLEFHPVPAAIVAVIPELEPYYYIVVDGQVVFVDPGTYEIVYVMSLA
jgi:hypothetical protein